MYRETTCIVRKDETNSTTQIPNIYLQFHLQENHQQQEKTNI